MKYEIAWNALIQTKADILQWINMYGIYTIYFAGYNPTCLQRTVVCFCVFKLIDFSILFCFVFEICVLKRKGKANWWLMYLT